MLGRTTTVLLCSLGLTALDAPVVAQDCDPLDDPSCQQGYEAALRERLFGEAARPSMQPSTGSVTAPALSMLPTAIAVVGRDAIELPAPDWLTTGHVGTFLDGSFRPIGGESSWGASVAQVVERPTFVLDSQVVSSSDVVTVGASVLGLGDASGAVESLFRARYVRAEQRNRWVTLPEGGAVPRPPPAARWIVSRIYVGQMAVVSVRGEETAISGEASALVPVGSVPVRVRGGAQQTSAGVTVSMRLVGLRAQGEFAWRDLLDSSGLPGALEATGDVPIRVQLTPVTPPSPLTVRIARVVFAPKPGGWDMEPNDPDIGVSLVYSGTERLPPSRIEARARVALEAIDPIGDRPSWEGDGRTSPPILISSATPLVIRLWDLDVGSHDIALDHRVESARPGTHCFGFPEDREARAGICLTFTEAPAR